MQTRNHNIGKVSFHLKGVKTEKVFTQRQVVAAYLQGSFTNMLEEVLNDMDVKDTVLYIPRLKIDLKEPVDGLNTNKLNILLKQELKKQLELHAKEQLSLSIKDSHQTETDRVYFKADRQNSLLFWQQVWTYYLQHGYLPNYIAQSLWNERLNYFMQLRMEQPQGLKKYFIDVLKIEVQLRRFLLNEKESIQSFVFETLYPQFELLYQQLFKNELKSSGKEQAHQNLLFLFNTSLSEMLMQDARVEEMINAKEKISQPGLLNAKKETDQHVLHQQPSQDASVFITNAGIVLLQPFITQLFHVLKITDEERKILHQPAKACAVLSLLAGDVPDETKYPLYKILCGLQPNALVNTNIKITADERKECNNLLQSVIEHWVALKQISTTSLQQTFLQRNGKLSFSNEQWLLQVEQKTEDILLQFLPWSYSIIRYPWMKQALFVEWT